MDSDPYDVAARYYDQENADVTDDIPFWLELAAEHGGPVLELGGGTGRVLFRIAASGVRTLGIDASAAMLALGRAKLARRADLAERVELLQADMRRFDLGPERRNFALAISPFNAFAHLLTHDDQLACLLSVARHLRPGGTLALDLPNPAETFATGDLGLALERTFRDDVTGNMVQQFSSMTLDRGAQLGHVTWLYDAVTPEGMVHRTVVPMSFRYTFPGEMDLLLERADFRLVSLYGEYDRRPFGQGAPRMLVLARRS